MFPMLNKYRLLLVALMVEKIVQHAVVSLAFVWDIGELRSNVAVDYRILLFAGLLIGSLYFVASLGVLRAWSLARLLAAIPASMDIVGEFVAQGKLDIVVTLSFIVAATILIILVLSKRNIIQID